MTGSLQTLSVEQALTETAADIDRKLDRLLPLVEGPEGSLAEAMRYATIGGGKRLRAFLALSSAALFGVSRDCALRTAAAIECIHGYSLIHDDLPCMDDDDLRRGKPTVHKQYDEATAVLAGDALHTLGFEILADEQTHADPRVRLELLRSMAHAIGFHGMVGGQMIDLQAASVSLDLLEITRLQNMKTGALICFAAEAGAILGRAASEKRVAIKGYAQNLGLAFQIADDLLDIEGSAAETGKSVRKDAKAGKATLVGAFGVERARLQAEMLVNQGIEHLSGFGEPAELLRSLARFAITRKK